MTTLTELRRDRDPEAEAVTRRSRADECTIAGSQAKREVQNAVCVQIFEAKTPTTRRSQRRTKVDHTWHGGNHDHADGEVANRALEPHGVWRGGVRSSSAHAKTQHVSEHAEREYHVGQHVNSQVLDVTKASHCTGSVSSALASGDAGRGGTDTGPHRQVKRGVHSSTNQYLRGVSRSR